MAFFSSSSIPAATYGHALPTSRASHKCSRTPPVRCSLKTFQPPPVDLGPVRVSPIGVGTWSWGNQVLWGYTTDDDAELEAVFKYLVTNGINFFDTADSYGTGKLNGRSEQLLGQFLESSLYIPNAHDVKIATKFAPYPWRLSRASIIEACKASMRRLKKNTIEIGQLHWSTAKYAPWQEETLWDALGDLHEQGLVQAVGVSNYGPRQLRKIHRRLALRNVPIASCQVQLSLLSTSPLTSGLLETCRELDVGIIGYSPLALGALSGKYSGSRVPEGLRGGALREVLEGAGGLLGCLEEVAREREASVAQVAVNWVVAKGAVAIPGARRIDQARDVVEGMRWRLSGAEVMELDSAAGKVEKQVVQNIFMTK